MPGQTSVLYMFQWF